MKNLILIILSLLLHFLEVNAQELRNEEHSKLEVTYSNNSNEFKKTIWLKISLDEGWKTYWKYPGDSGEAVQVEILDQNNIKEFEIFYPIPKRFIDSGIETIGYENQVIFPVEVEFKNDEDLSPLDLRITYLICKEICLPITENKRIYFDTKQKISTYDLNEFNNTLRRIPTKVLKNFELKKIIKISNNHLRLHINKNNQKEYERVFIFSNFNKFDEKFYETDEGLIIDLISQEKIIENHDISIYLSSLNRVEEINLKNKKVEIKPNIFLMIMFAMIGGFLLNFMPCVFPVLSLKIYSLIKIMETSVIKVSKLSFITFLGITFSFFLIAVMTIFLKELGLMVGWGIQFQSKEFIIFLSLVIFIFALNLFGLFEIILPNKVSNLLNISVKSKNLNAFITGAVSTVLATPCSAPFLGTSIGYALSQNNSSILLIFSFLAIGFSIPYLLITLFPKIINVFPKPGKWMNAFKMVLGFMMLITSVWLLSLLGVNKKTLYVILISISIFLIILNNEVTKKNKFLISSFILIFVFFINNFVESRNGNFKSWQNFSEEKLNFLIANDELVFLDITADWCVTCQINKLVVMNNTEVNKFFEDNNVNLMRADWTDKNSNILNFLSNYNRFGVPFNIVYGPENKDGTILSELLTKEAVFKEISSLRRSNENKEK